MRIQEHRYVQVEDFSIIREGVRSLVSSVRMEFGAIRITKLVLLLLSGADLFHGCVWGDGA